MICYGICSVLSTNVIRGTTKWIGRPVVMLFGAVLHTGLLIWYDLWQLEEHTSQIIYFVSAGLWGIANSVWLVEINGRNYFYLFSINDLFYSVIR